MKSGKLFMLSISLLMLACRGNHTIKKVQVSDHELTLTLDVNNEHQNIYFQNRYDVTGMNKEQQDKLVERVCDSLGVKN